ncbi:MAG: phage holin family protein [Salibacteraceae bacterium]
MNLERFIIHTLLTSVAVVLCAYLLPGVHVSGFGSALLVALALALLNQFVKPILILFTIPATILTLGLFLLVINALLILLADWMVMSFTVDGFWWALLFSILLTLVKSVLLIFTGENNRNRLRNPED